MPSRHNHRCCPEKPSEVNHVGATERKHRAFPRRTIHLHRPYVKSLATKRGNIADNLQDSLCIKVDWTCSKREHRQYNRNPENSTRPRPPRDIYAFLGLLLLPRLQRQLSEVAPSTACALCLCQRRTERKPIRITACLRLSCAKYGLLRPPVRYFPPREAEL